MKPLVFALFFLTFSAVFAQEMETELGGFKLGQYREAPKNEFKTLIKQGKFEDGFEYEAYPVLPDQSVYMIFEYADSNHEIIWSIQLAGTKQGYDCKFRGLKLAMPSKDVEQILGKPSAIEDAGEYGKRWEYIKANYSVEITPEGILGSVKIMDKFPPFVSTDISKIPSFDKYSAVLKSKNRSAISDLLAPSVEIYKSDTTIFFQRSMANEIKNDSSGVFKIMDEVGAALMKTDRSKAGYEENVRIQKGVDPLHVAKFTSSNKLSEIVFRYMFGKYLIWEIRLK
jgi:hypothetical protein